MPKIDYLRKITATLPHFSKQFSSNGKLKQGLGVFVVIFLVSFTATLGILLYQTYQKYQSELVVRQQVKEKLIYWESVISQYPQFPVAYYEAAVYATRLSEQEKAKDFIEKALFIDPNFFEAEVLAKELE